MALFEDAIEILRRIVVAVGTERFIDSLAKTCEKIDLVDYKAKGQKINNYKIRPPNSFSLAEVINTEVKPRKANSAMRPPTHAEMLFIRNSLLEYYKYLCDFHTLNTWMMDQFYDISNGEY